MNAITVRDAREDDCAAMQVLYAHHVEHGLASWEESPPDVAEIRRRMQAVTSAGYPFRVAEYEGALRGYAYASSYRPRPAYRYCVENSVYVDAAYQGLGIGGTLLEDLIVQCTALGYRQMIAVIGDSKNAASIKLHTAQGFEHCAIMPALGFKHGQWLDQVLMQRSLGEGDKTKP